MRRSALLPCFASRPAGFNHACRPNCFVSWNDPIGKQTVHAVADIAGGDELTISYVAGSEAGARARRRALLESKYLFTCECAVCCLEGAQLGVSDFRYERLAQLHTRLAQLGEGDGRLGVLELVSLVEEQLKLSREEGVPLILSKAGWILAAVHLKLSGDQRAAAEWATRGAEHSRLALGEDSSAFQRFSSLVAALHSSNY